MASSLSSSAPASASIVAKPTNYLPNYGYRPVPRISFRLSRKPKLRLFSKACRFQTSWSHRILLKAKQNKVSVDGSSNASGEPSNKSEAEGPEASGSKPSREPSPAGRATEETISAFMTQVSSLVKLVDSRDIVELKLKQLDCELIIRKREALPQQSSAPVVMMQSPSPAALTPPTQAPPLGPSPAPQPSPSPSAAQAAKSSLPPLKSPMAGTFYRSPGPGEPPFVKVGDKVEKGQVLCIIEAMKLMNEIEADQSGTIAEILVEDGKPVSLETPLFVIQP